MKFVLAFTLSLFTASAFAATCKLNTTYFEGFHCASISTKFKVSIEEECIFLAKSTKDNNFFGVLTGKSEKILRTKYKFKEDRRKVVDKIIFEDSAPYCGF